MQVYNIEIENVLPILTDQVEAIRNFNDSQSIYLSRTYNSSTLSRESLKRHLKLKRDEILDIISEFSKHGRVTFCLDESEAVKLWMVLNGERPDYRSNAFALSELKRKYFSIFKTMTVDRLLIYSANDALVYSEDQQFVLTRKVVDHNIEVANDARDNFIAGFTVGLILQLDVKHCIALGLVVFGSHGENNSNPDKGDLLAYIEKWIADISKDASISLYQ